MVELTEAELDETGPERTCIVTRAKGSPGDARALLPELLAAAGGKGGGSPEMVQLSAVGAGEARYGRAPDNFADLAHSLEITVGGNGKAGLNDVDSKLLQRFGQTQLFLEVH